MTKVRRGGEGGSPGTHHAVVDDGPGDGVLEDTEPAGPFVRLHLGGIQEPLGRVLPGQLLGLLLRQRLGVVLLQYS